MLDTHTLPASAAPGSTARGRLSSADWRFLLPGATYGSVLHIGAPDPSVDLAFDPNATRITRVSAEDLNTMPPAGRFDLITVSRDSIDTILRRHSTLARALGLLAEEGSLYLETRRLSHAVRAVRQLPAAAAESGLALQMWRVAKRQSGLRVAFPPGGEGVAEHFFSRVLYGTSLKGRLIGVAGRVGIRLGLVGFVAPHRAAVLTKSKQTGAVPSYLTKIAARHGCDLSREDVGFLARGNYDSNKVAFFIHARGTPEPHTVIKLTRAPRFNGRLESAYQATEILHKRGFAREGSFPQPLFLDYHEGLAVLGERAATGVPFKTRSTGLPDCPVVGSALQWITEVGSKSVHPPPDGGPAALAVRQYQRFTEIYEPSPFEQDFLKSQLGKLREASALPHVFQHGDAHLGNILVDDQGRPVFLDWEAAALDGVPLWDLFQFLGGIASWRGRQSGVRDSVDAFDATVIAGGPLASLYQRAVDQYCEQVGLKRSLAEPLFFHGWIHRALRQAVWTQQPLHQARYLRLLRLCIRSRSTGGMSWLSE